MTITLRLCREDEVLVDSKSLAYTLNMREAIHWFKLTPEQVNNLKDGLEVIIG